MRLLPTLTCIAAMALSPGCSSLPVSPPGAGTPGKPSESTAAWIAKASAESAIPGVSVAVVRNYRIAWAAGFGLKDKAGRLPVEDRTLFQAASVSKPVTAIATLIALEERGIPVDMEVNSILAQGPPAAQIGPWVLPNRYPVPVTVRMLLSHTGGTSDFRYSGYRYAYYAKPPAPIDAIPTMRQELNGLPPANRGPIEVIRLPGVTWQYSPAGYTVIQAMLMSLHDQPFDDIMSKLVLQPLGMRNSSFTQPMPPHVAAAIAIPYEPDGKPLRDGPRVFNTAASGGLTTTPTDLARLIIAFQHALAGRPQGRLTPRIARSMMERQTGSIPEGRCLGSSITGEYACRSSWGLGFDVNLNRYLEHQPDGKPTGGYFGHTGFNSGYLTVLIASKEGGNGLVIMVNSAPEDMSADVPQFGFMTRLVRQIADEEGWE